MRRFLTVVAVLAVAGTCLAHAASQKHECGFTARVEKIKHRAAALHMKNPFHFRKTGADRPVHKRNLAETEFKPIRIRFITDLLGDASDSAYTCQSADDTYVEADNIYGGVLNCNSEDVLVRGDAKYSTIINEIVPAALETLQTLLSVQRWDGTNDGPLPLEQFGSGACGGAFAFACCSDATAYAPAFDPTPYAFTDTDVVMVLTSRPTGGGTVAYALNCGGDPETGRPVFGDVNINPRQIDSDPAAFDTIKNVIIHEIMHVLGFSSSSFDEFVDPDNGHEVVPYDQVVRSAFEPGLGKVVTRVVSPRVAALYREHLGCQDWPNAGIELEDIGGAGTAGSHWESRLMLPDIMIGYVQTNMKISVFTLALLEDSGWYRADYSLASRRIPGRQLGCDYAQKSCEESWPSSVLCTGGVASCSPEHSARGVCDASVIYDGCFMSIPFTHTDTCTSDQATVDPSRAETVGAGSACFMSSVSNGGPTDIQPSCLRFQCAGGTTQVIVDGMPFTCPVAGGTIPVETPNFSGDIECPDAVVMDCACPPNAVHDGATCVCPGSQTYDGAACVCPATFVADGDACVCKAPAVLQGDVCVCPSSFEAITDDGSCRCPARRQLVGDSCGCDPLMIVDDDLGCTCGPPLLPTPLDDGSCVCEFLSSVTPNPAQCSCPDGDITIGTLGFPTVVSETSLSCAPCPTPAKVSEGSESVCSACLPGDDAENPSCGTLAITVLPDNFPEEVVVTVVQHNSDGSLNQVLFTRLSESDAPQDTFFTTSVFVCSGVFEVEILDTYGDGGVSDVLVTFNGATLLSDSDLSYSGNIAWLLGVGLDGLICSAAGSDDGDCSALVAGGFWYDPQNGSVQAGPIMSMAQYNAICASHGPCDAPQIVVTLGGVTYVRPPRWNAAAYEAAPEQCLA